MRANQLNMASGRYPRARKSLMKMGRPVFSARRLLIFPLPEGSRMTGRWQ